jgi:DNA replication protein DnaC
VDAARAGADLEARLIERQLKNADRALGNRMQDGAAPHGPRLRHGLAQRRAGSRLPRMVQACSARGHGTLCFYGPPGTGKTALAEHIASTLAQPLNVKQASDLMSKYVGETEQNMAAMFREAEAEKASCCSTRPTASCRTAGEHSATYEVSEVNEMLQGMERFHGIFHLYHEPDGSH